MPIEKIRFISCSDNDSRDICGVTLHHNKKCIQFYDRSFPKFHISFHKDCSTWLTSENRSIKPKKLFSKGRFLNEEDIMPFIYYFPIKREYYPEDKEDKQKVKIFLDNTFTIEKSLIKLFLINKKLSLKKVLKKHRNITQVKIQGKTNQGIFIEKYQEMAPLVFEQHKVYFDIVKSSRGMCPRIILICKPNSKLDLIDFIENTELVIEPDKLNGQRIVIKEYRYKKFKIYQLTY